MKPSLILLSALIFIACEADYSIPEPKDTSVPFEATSTLPSITNNLDSYAENIVTFYDDLSIEAYVVSSDKAGNFYNELILQDSTENPSVGIALQIDENSLFERYPLGSKIIIQLKNLSIAYQNGVIELGVLQENSIEPLSEYLIDQHIFRTGEVAAVIPQNISLTSIDERHLNQFIKLEGMQFPEALFLPTPKTLAAENSDSFDGIRPMLHCETGLEIQLSTSVFASFKTMNIPALNGNIEGVLTKDFDNLHYVLKMNSASDLQFTQENRCSSSYFNCPAAAVLPTEILFEENFENITNENQLTPLGWQNVNVTGDEDRWTDKKITNVDNRVMTISAFNSGLQPLHSWLIPPPVNANGMEDIYFSCRFRTLFNNGDALKIWVTNAYTGDPVTTHWEQVDVDLPNFSSNYITIQQRLGCLSGEIYIGFEYKGYDSVLTSTYDIDDVLFYR